jgi:ribosomal protein S27AE
VRYDKPDPKNLSGLEDSAKLEQLGDEELNAIALRVHEAERSAQVSKLKYLARQKKDRLEAEAARYALMLEEHEALSESGKFATYLESVLAKHPVELSELKKRIERFGLTLREALREELEITPEDYKCYREIFLKHTHLPYKSLGEYVVGRLKAWLKYERLQERKVQLETWLSTNHPTCPNCGNEYMESKEQGAIACLHTDCKWQGYIPCPACGSSMGYSKPRGHLQCVNEYCRLIWKWSPWLDNS